MQQIRRLFVASITLALCHPCSPAAPATGSASLSNPAPRLPSGPAGPGRFGAYATRLAFIPEWDAPWRIGPRADVVVRFDTSSARLVFWHGAHFVPCWVNENGTWTSQGAVQRPDAGPHNDRLCRFAFASVVESHEARVVVRSRYAPADAHGNPVNLDPVTRWHDWVDETHTIYPDATAVRLVTLHSSRWEDPLWVQQWMLIAQPGEPAPTPPPAPQAETQREGHIGWLPLSGGNPFHVMAGPVEPAAPATPWGDWPARGASPKPSHQVLGGVQWKPCSEALYQKSWRMLAGVETAASPPANSTAATWLNPPAIRAQGRNCQSHGFQTDEKAYLITTAATPAADPLRLTLAASPSSPVVNPAFVIKGWGKTPARLAVDGTPRPWGPDSRHGYRKTATGTDLVVWVRLLSTSPVSLELRPDPDEKP